MKGLRILAETDPTNSAKLITGSLGAEKQSGHGEHCED